MNKGHKRFCEGYKQFCEHETLYRCYDAGDCKGERITLKSYWVEAELRTADRKFRAQHWK